mgnify:CR=1 FL=1
MAESELARLRSLALLFLDEKAMHGAAGLELTDAMRVSIAAQACLPILNLGVDTYGGWTEGIVYPGEFRVQREEIDEDGSGEIEFGEFRQLLCGDGGGEDAD